MSSRAEFVQDFRLRISRRGVLAACRMAQSRVVYSPGQAACGRHTLLPSTSEYALTRGFPPSPPLIGLSTHQAAP